MSDSLHLSKGSLNCSDLKHKTPSSTFRFTYICVSLYEDLWFLINICYAQQNERGTGILTCTTAARDSNVSFMKSIHLMFLGNIHWQSILMIRQDYGWLCLMFHLKRQTSRFMELQSYVRVKAKAEVIIEDVERKLRGKGNDSARSNMCPILHAGRVGARSLRLSSSTAFFTVKPHRMSGEHYVTQRCVWTTSWSRN